eukprot:CAMPEP_0117680124 /NCGR_PEP_ID=MMETSP0804-20121206/18172_1 /TAXON_ID=1074897 /ORGANISM="Tetraselmis astigmatica, Strain CCMP880" /LENGTH=393 /DNA_ID=CAMNT_0005489575 /DNA_START=149 /DNA_END=1330 /DNA_ORIENTATION=+
MGGVCPSRMTADDNAVPPSEDVQNTGKRTVLKGRWGVHHVAPFSYDPFGGTGNWGIEMEEGDLLDSGVTLHEQEHSSYREDPGHEHGHPEQDSGGLWAASTQPAMCAKLAYQALESSAAHRMRAEPSPGEGPLQDFVRRHSVEVTLLCKKHPDEGQADSMMLAMRPVTPADRHIIQSALADLSLRSQVMRFLAPVPKLSEAELNALTQLDYRLHFAWGLRTGPHGLAIGRYACHRSDPTRADIAVTVVDAAQGLGLSSLLIWALSHMACKHGVKVFTALYHHQNAPVAKSVERLQAAGLPVRIGEGDGGRTVEIDLPIELPHTATKILSECDLFRFMRAVDGQTPPSREEVGLASEAGIHIAATEVETPREKGGGREDAAGRPGLYDAAVDMS